MRVSLQYFVTLTAVIAIAMLPCKVSLGGGYCKWTDENGVVHYAEKCPEKTLTEQVEIQPPPSEQQIVAAKERYDEMQKNKLAHNTPAGTQGKFRSLPLKKLGPLPDNTKSEFLSTTSTGISFKFKQKVGQFTLTLEPKGLQDGMLLEIHFPDPGDPDRKDIVEKVLQPGETTILVLSPYSQDFKCWNYGVEVFIYGDESKSELLGTHFQTIQSRVDLSKAKDALDLLTAMQGGRCPPG